MEPAMCLCGAVASCQIHTQNNRHINILAEYQRQIEMYAQIDTETVGYPIPIFTW